MTDRRVEQLPNEVGLYRCPVPGCARKIARFEVEGDVLVITPVAKGRVLEPSLMDMGEYEDQEAVAIWCHRHYSGASYAVTVEYLLDTYRCASLRIVTTEALERDAGS